MSDNKKSCCDRITKAETEVEGQGRRIENLETLYTPVARLSVLFYICLFFLGSFLTLSGYTWKKMDEVSHKLSINNIIQEQVKTDVSELVEKVRAIEKRKLDRLEQLENKYSGSDN